MLDIVKMVIDLLSKFINPSEISKLRREKRLTDLDIELFFLYVDLNEILLAGEEMIENWKYYLNRIDRRRGYGYDTYSMPKSFTEARLGELLWQIHRIQGLGRVLSKFSAQLQILNAEAYLKLTLLLFRGRGKLLFLEELHIVIGREEFMPLLSEDMLNDALKEIIKYEEGHYGDRDDVFRNATKKLFEEVIPLSDSSSWDASIYKKVESYLNSGKPRQQLDEIRTVLQQLYSTLKDNFSIQDILLKVGDRRPSDTN
jgi:hypothetical protein